jgi:glutathione synthase/RimK-type ligase-like ATP-grasp enzyme
MKIAIHEQKGSFSDKWIEYCEKGNIEFKIVNCFSTNIVEQLEGCDGLLWHWDQNDYRAMVFAKQLTISVQKLGIRTFPDVKTSFHFDDKIAQKYLFESIEAPHIPTYIFYDKAKALEWSRKAKFPKVFKLRSGSAAVNVKLVKTRKYADKLIRRAFHKGFKHIDRKATLKDKIRLFANHPNPKSFVGIFKGLYRYFFKAEIEKMSNRHKGYVYFQDFIPENDFDTRLYVIGNRCFGTRRYNRKNDFRASGSKNSRNDKELFDIEAIKLAFKLSEKIKSQSIAFDFIRDKDQYKLIEISYTFPARNLYNHPGFWDKNLEWHKEKIIPEYFIIEDFINSLK